MKFEINTTFIKKFLKCRNQLILLFLFLLFILVDYITNKKTLTNYLGEYVSGQETAAKKANILLKHLKLKTISLCRDEKKVN